MKKTLTLRCVGLGCTFAKKVVDCFEYYSFNPANHVAEVIAYGDVKEARDKCCTNKLEIVREIPWMELLAMLNTGTSCTGKGNSGDHNSGCRNAGYCNSGDRNSGYCNSGSNNSGCRNSGHFNSGSRNSGHFNSGSHNSGDWNECNFSSGCFNTVDQKIYFFNQPSEWTYKDWYYSKAREILSEMPAPLEYVLLKDMTKKEKKKHPGARTTGGYLRERTTTEAVNLWWKKLSEENKEIILAMPNFDSRIFREITGIDVDAV